MREISLVAPHSASPIRIPAARPLINRRARDDRRYTVENCFDVFGVPGNRGNMWATRARRKSFGVLVGEGFCNFLDAQRFNFSEILVSCLITSIRKPDNSFVI